MSESNKTGKDSLLTIRVVTRAAKSEIVGEFDGAVKLESLRRRLKAQQTPNLLNF